MVIGQLVYKTSKSEKEETDYYCDFSYFPFGTENLSHSVSDLILYLKYVLRYKTLNSLNFMEIESDMID